MRQITFIGNIKVIRGYILYFVCIIHTMIPESSILVCSSFFFMCTSLYAMYYRSIHFSLLNALLTVSEVMYWMNPVEGWWKLINNAVVGCCIFIYFVEGSYQICVVHMHTHLKTIGVLFSAALFNLYVKAFFQQALQRPDWWLYELWFQLVAAVGQAYVIKLTEMEKSL